MTTIYFYRGPEKHQQIDPEPLEITDDGYMVFDSENLEHVGINGHEIELHLGSQWIVSLSDDDVEDIIKEYLGT